MENQQVNGNPPIHIQVALSDEDFQKLENIFRRCLIEIKEEALFQKLLSPAEASQLFVPPVTVQTLSNWTKKGILRKHYIGTKPYYKYSEILGALKSLNRYQVR